MATITAAPSTIATPVTAAEFLGRHFEHPVELVAGEIVEMPPASQYHGCCVARVVIALGNWALSRGLGEVTSNDSAVRTRQDPDTVRGPDACFFAKDRLPNGKLEPGQTDIVPTLCVEVLSPSNRWNEMFKKVGEYLELGVLEVWLVDPTAKTVWCCRDDVPPRSVATDATLTTDVLPEFTVPVSDLFAGT